MVVISKHYQISSDPFCLSFECQIFESFTRSKLRCVRSEQRDEPRPSRLSYYEQTRHLNSMGILTLETVPGLNRHFRNVRTAESSSIGFPVLCVIETSVTLPLPGSISRTQTPLPVIWRARISDG